MSIKGTWISHYEYGQGVDNEPQFSEHRIVFSKVDGVWNGQSEPDADGSEVTITLKEQDAEFSGEWKEHTSPSGHYQGREFSGLLKLVLQDDGAELSGMWLGVSSSTSQVKAGQWMFTRASSK